MERVGTSSKAAKPTSKDPNEVVLPTPYPPSFFYTSLLVTKPPSSPSNEPLLPFPPYGSPDFCQFWTPSLPPALIRPHGPHENDH